MKDPHRVIKVVFGNFYLVEMLQDGNLTKESIKGN
jgi:hypothetical protein